MPPEYDFSRPSTIGLYLAFVLGALLGVGFVLPVVRDDVAVDAVLGSGPVGNVVLIGVLAILVVSMGLFGLVRLFLLADP